LGTTPECTLSELPLRSPATSDGHSGTRHAVRSVFPSFESVASAHSEAPAVVQGETVVDYVSLRAQARAVAAVIATHGPHARIALLLDPTVAMPAAMLGVLAAGQIYVPLDPRLPPSRLLQIVEDAGPAALIVAPAHRALAVAIAPELEHYDLSAVGEGDDAEVLVEVGPDDPAYLLYTSGSTGTPKAVVQSQANLVHHARTYAASVGMGPGDRVSLVASYAFDAAVMDIYGALLTGASLHLIDVHGEGLGTLVSSLHAEAIEVFHATPTVFRELVAQIDAGAPAPRLRWVVLGGERARPADIDAARRVFGPGCGLINGLGPTECTVALQHRLDPPLPDRIVEVPVGVPVDGVEVRVRTPVGDQPAPFGVGELELRGPAVAHGYWRRPELTAAAFTELGSGARAYRSGDQVRWGQDGTLTFVGRGDTQVKIHGRRIELGEVEAHLRTAPGVREAAVVVRAVGSTSRLVGVFVPRIQGHDPREAIDDHLRSVLPAWMVPSAFVAQAQLPRTPTNKLDRQALLAVASDDARTHPPGSDARATPSQARVLALWSRVLGEPLARPHADWFSCGGDSLTAVQLSRVIHRELGLEVSLAELFEGVTAADLAQRLEAGAGPATPTRRARLHARPLPDDVAPLVCVLPPGARLRMFDALARELGPRLWVLQPPGLGLRGPLPTLADIADECLSTLPTRRLHLAGMSNGGLLALALARQWPTHLPNIETICLLDTLPSAWLRADPWSQREQGRRRAAFVADLCGLRADPNTLVDSGAIERMHAWAVECGVVDRTMSVQQLREMARVHDQHHDRVWRILSADGTPWPAKTTTPPIHLFEASDREGPSLEAAWRQQIPHIRQHAIPGDHLGILVEPHVPALARALRAVLWTRRSN
nr:amino acid adenylation domain-containing protein [Deltaproteobacteria bacterium]